MPWHGRGNNCSRSAIQKDRRGFGLCIAFRNSYDRSMSVGMAIGASVFICDNLALSGDITVMKKHTKNVWTTLEDLAISTIYKATKRHQQIQEDSEHLIASRWTTASLFAHRYFVWGRYYKPRQLTTVKDQWIKPDQRNSRSAMPGASTTVVPRR